MKKIFLILLIITLFLIPVFAEEVVALEKQIVNVYFFGTSTCPYCADEKAFFTEYVKENKDVKVYYFQLDKVRDSSKFLLEFSKAFDERSTSVPITFISEKVWIGFSENIKTQMVSVIDNCLENNCKDSFDYIENNESLKKYIKDPKYFQIIGEESLKEDKINLFKRIILFFKNLF